MLRLTSPYEQWWVYMRQMEVEVYVCGGFLFRTKMISLLRSDRNFTATHNKMLTKTKLALCCANLFRNCLSCQLANSHSHLNGLKIQDRSRKMLKSPQISESALALITSASWWMYMSVSIKSRLMLMCSRNGLRCLCYDNLTLTKTVYPIIKMSQQVFIC